MTATIAVHEFISADGVFESPTWTFEFGFDPRMGETLAAITGSATAILLGRKTHEMFAPELARPDRRGRPGRAVLQRDGEARRRRAGARRGVGQHHQDRALRRRRDPPTQAGAGRRHLHLGQRSAGPRPPPRRAGRRDPPVRLPDLPRQRRSLLGGRGTDEARPAGQRRLRQRRRAPLLRARRRPDRRTLTTWRSASSTAKACTSGSRTTSRRCSPATTASTGSTSPPGTRRPRRC